VQKAHGRIDQHDISLCSVDPLSINFPYVQTVVRVRRESTAFKKAADRLPGYYLSSMSAQSMKPEQWLERIRGHWGGIEIRNHWRKDACLLEDKTRSRNPNTVAAMSMLRNCALFFLNEDPHTSNINAFTEAVAADSGKALDMLMRRF
jgi:predicted transposase YbfD/YdcC